MYWIHSVYVLRVYDNLDGIRNIGICSGLFALGIMGGRLRFSEALTYIASNYYGLGGAFIFIRPLSDKSVCIGGSTGIYSMQITSATCIHTWIAASYVYAFRSPPCRSSAF